MSGPHYEFDVLVVGAGHAGTEAACAAARQGARTALLTTNCDTVGQMSCNPAIGGVAKGQLAREIDALGGLMGRAIDAAGLQFRLLNRRKGPAMHSPRAQADKRAYQQEIKRLVEEQPGLSLRQETVHDLLVEDGPDGNRVAGLAVRGGAVYHARAVVITTGTFLQAIMHTGEAQTPGGRAGEGTSTGLSAALVQQGLRLARFKTGTPPRLQGRTIDYAQLEEQPGDETPTPFSFLTERIAQPQLPCWITHTNAQVHEIIRANLHRAPMYSGQIQSRGPRYCPSLEDKVVRFAEKESHQIFLEPEGWRTHEIYVNGVSTSLPRDVQDAIIRLIPGLQQAEIMRYGYAVEYDYAPPDQLWPSLETKVLPGLFLAGQINGTTGYEEAGGQGLLAGLNAARSVAGLEPVVLGREQAYLGVLIDDLVTQSVDEPYRMFTSRAEHRLLLRHDNADRRLTPLGREWGIVDAARYARLERKQTAIERFAARLQELRLGQFTAEQVLRRPETTWDELVAQAPELSAVSADVAEQLTWDVKYAGYIARQAQAVARQARWEEKRIPTGFDYARLVHLRTETREKLQRIRPTTLGQALRISGVTPADVALLQVYLSSPRR